MTAKCTWVDLPDENSSSFAKPKPCTNNAIWKSRCSEHGGKYPTARELMTLLADLTGWSDQMLTVHMRCLNSFPGNRQKAVWLVSTTICGSSLQASASGDELETALWELSKEVVARLQDAARRFDESAEKADARLKKFLEDKS